MHLLSARSKFGNRDLLIFDFAYEFLQTFLEATSTSLTTSATS